MSYKNALYLFWVATPELIDAAKHAKVKVGSWGELHADAVREWAVENGHGGVSGTVWSESINQSTEDGRVLVSGLLARELRRQWPKTWVGKRDGEAAFVALIQQRLAARLLGKPLPKAPRQHGFAWTDDAQADLTRFVDEATRPALTDRYGLRTRKHTAVSAVAVAFGRLTYAERDRLLLRNPKADFVSRAQAGWLLGRASYCTGASLDRHIKPFPAKGKSWFPIADVLALRTRLDKGREPVALPPTPNRFERGLLDDD